MAFFEDSLPDAWGRALLIRQYRLPRSEQHPVRLLDCLGANGLGALIYSCGDEPPKPSVPVLCATQDLIDAALRYEQAPSSVEELHLRALFQAASSPGGARPKLLIEDQGRPCIAKLASVRDSFDMVRLEAASLALTRMVLPYLSAVETDVWDGAVLLVLKPRVATWSP